MPYIRRHLIRISYVSLLLPVLFLASCRNSLSLYLPVLNDIPPLIGDPPKNVILIIGDGMGEEHIKARSIQLDGTEDTGLHIQDKFAVTTLMGTRNAWGGITDSAASATAMATGSKVNNGVLSLQSPGNGASLTTLAEMARADGKAIGLVTTDNVLSATPAAFSVHQSSRNNLTGIAEDMMGFRPNVLFGGGLGLSGAAGAAADTAGYTVVVDETGLGNLTETPTMPFYYYGRFGDDIMPYETDDRGDLPSLDGMTAKALDLLEENSDGFFLVIENELTDEASHLNDLEKLVAEVDALDHAVDVALTWAGYPVVTDTLVLVLADHETGGLKILGNNGAGKLPTVSWSTPGHTQDKVRIFSWGKQAEEFSLVLENVDIFRLISRYY